MRPYGKCRVEWRPEGASSTFKAGYPVIQGAAGVEQRVIVSADNPVAAIVGVAAQDASGVTGALVPVWCADPDKKFIVTTVASDAVDFTDIGSCRALQAHASLAIWVVDTTDAGNDSVVVEGYLNPLTMTRQVAEGDSEVYAIVHFDPKATIFGAGT